MTDKIDLFDLGCGELQQRGLRVVGFDPDLYGQPWRPTIFVVPVDYEEELSNDTIPSTDAHLSTSKPKPTTETEQDTMRKKDVFPSTYLKMADVPQPVAATIKRMRFETVGVGDNAKDKAALEFTESTLKPLILNAGNWETIEAAFGDSEDWVGRKIVIFPDPTVMYKGQKVGGLRVRIPTTKAPAAPAAPPVQEELPDIEYDFENEPEAD